MSRRERRTFVLGITFLFTAHVIPACFGYRQSGLIISLELATDTSTLRRLGNSAMITNDLGHELILDKVYLVTSSLELRPCSVEPVLPPWLQAFGVSVAHAHVPSTPLRQGTPIVEAPLHAPIRSHGVLEPSPGDYCGLHYAIAAADDDALGLPNEVDMVGTSLLVQGTVHVGDTSQAFEIRTGLAFDRTLPFGDDNEPLVVDADTELTLQVRRDMARWFDGVDVTATAPDRAARALITNIVQHAEVIH